MDISGLAIRLMQRHWNAGESGYDLMRRMRALPTSDSNLKTHNSALTSAPQAPCSLRTMSLESCSQSSSGT